MAGWMQAVVPPACGFLVGWATRRRLAEAAKTCLTKEGREVKPVKREVSRFEQKEKKQEPDLSGRWCDCSSVAVVHRMYLSSSSFPEFASAVRKLAASRTATPGFKGMCVFRRALEQQPAAAAAATATAAAAAAPGAGGSPASRKDAAGAEFLLVEEWLNPLAAAEALNPPRGSRGEHNQMRGTPWACMAAEPL
ncbi:hypothetical protein ACSSS7_007077 [Eimeria intestinalis]